MNLYFWLFERSFAFELNGSIETADQSLTALKTPDKFGNSPDELTLESADNGYSFRYGVRRSFQGRGYTTAIGEGDIWQASNGTVVVEGTAQINPWELYGGFFITGLVVAFAIPKDGVSPVLGLAVFVGWVIFWSLIHLEDRNRVIDLMAEVLDSRPTENDIDT